MNEFLLDVFDFYTAALPPFGFVSCDNFTGSMDRHFSTVHLLLFWEIGHWKLRANERLLVLWFWLAIPACQITKMSHCHDCKHAKTDLLSWIQNCYIGFAHIHSSKQFNSIGNQNDSSAFVWSNLYAIFIIRYLFFISSVDQEGLLFLHDVQGHHNTLKWYEL